MHHRSHDQGGLPTGGSVSGGLGRHTPGTRKAGDTHPTGMLSCIELELLSVFGHKISISSIDVILKMFSLFYFFENLYFDI